MCTTYKVKNVDGEWELQSPGARASFDMNYVGNLIYITYSPNMDNVSVLLQLEGWAGTCNIIMDYSTLICTLPCEQEKNDQERPKT